MGQKTNFVDFHFLVDKCLFMPRHFPKISTYKNKTGSMKIRKNKLRWMKKELIVKEFNRRIGTS